ncbi:Ankyrin repeat family protein [Striga hermonthica]|uniref:Ankyrin repeat family protein n=1 Tax=Striga hermonthica TaxID=68872 RepID=A0A9N7P2E3_STRHE|nr:Ankyrin repeat family protein [Striga hermonthica]
MNNEEENCVCVLGFKESKVLQNEGKTLIYTIPINTKSANRKPTRKEADSVAWRTDRVVLGWILGSLADTVVRTVARSHTARDVWVELDKKFGKANAAPPQVPQVVLVETEYEEQLPLLLRKIREEEWEDAKEHITRDPGAIRDQKTGKKDTCLHLAVSVNKPYAFDFVRFLGERMTEQTWQARNSLGENALHTAVRTGNDSATAFLLDEFSDLMHVRNNNGELPIHLAIQGAKEGSIWLLLGKMGNVVDEQTGFKLLCMAIDAEHFFNHTNALAPKHRDTSIGIPSGPIVLPPFILFIASRISASRIILTKHLLVSSNESTNSRVRPSLSPLNNLSKYSRHLSLISPSFTSGRSNSSLMHLISSVHHCKKNDHVLLVESLFKRLKDKSFSNTVQIYKDAMLTAVENRSETIFNEVYQIFNDNQFEFSKLKDAYENTPLHLVARLAPPHKLNLVSGAALQMQREIQWFKKVEKMCHDVYIRQRINLFEETPDMIFTYEHQQLKVDGEGWMKDTAKSCTIAAALIATVVFAAAITVPGGTESSSGYPFFSQKRAFIIFAVSDAISLFTSTTSLLMFLSILTSRYAEQDFLRSTQEGWILIPVAALACFPVASFMRQQSPLLVDVIYNTYCLQIFKQKKIIRSSFSFSSSCSRVLRLDVVAWYQDFKISIKEKVEKLKGVKEHLKLGWKTLRLGASRSRNSEV